MIWTGIRETLASSAATCMLLLQRTHGGSRLMRVSTFWPPSLVSPGGPAQTLFAVNTMGATSSADKAIFRNALRRFIRSYLFRIAGVNNGFDTRATMGPG